MEILKGWDYSLQDSAVSLGKFDGLHIGHRLLIDEIKRQKECVPTIFTFEVGSREREQGLVPVPGQMIYTQEEKDILFEELGIQREVLFPFDERTRMMEPEVFIRRILHGKLGARFVCVGEDFRFGKDRAGNVGLLKKCAQKYGYEVKIMRKQSSQGEIVSSTVIREKILNGELQRANELLGGIYFIVGSVVHGSELGRKLGMPTANLVPDKDKLLLPAGVYATQTLVDGIWYPSVTNIGKKPTVGNHQIGVETYIIGFQREIYGMKIQVRFHEFIRGEKKFPGLEELTAQMRRDEKQAKEIFSRRS